MSAQPLESFCATAEHVNAHCEAAGAAIALLHGIIPEFICLSAPNRPAQVSLPDQVPLVVSLDVAIAGLFAALLQMDCRVVKLFGRRKSARKIFDTTDLAAGFSRRDIKKAKRFFNFRSRAVFARLMAEDVSAAIEELAAMLIQDKAVTKAALEQFRSQHEALFTKEAL